MKVFISHSFDEKDQFNNVADAFKPEGINYWAPEEMMPGASLAEQLREAISKSELCVFVATKRSVNSAWCGAELGAFWGAGKKVLILIADSSLTQEQLPRQFQGHFVERRISNVVKAVTRYFEESRKETEVKDKAEVGNNSFTKTELTELIDAALERVQKGILASTVLRQIDEFLMNSSARELRINSFSSFSETEKKSLQSIMNNLLGLSRAAIENASLDWPNRVSFTTSSGDWEGYAKNEALQSYNYIYYPCLMFRYNDKKTVIASCILPAMAELDRGGVSINKPVAFIGTGEFGELINNP